MFNTQTIFFHLGVSDHIPLQNTNGCSDNSQTDLFFFCSCVMKNTRMPKNSYLYGLILGCSLLIVATALYTWFYTYTRNPGDAMRHQQAVLATASYRRRNIHIVSLDTRTEWPMNDIITIHRRSWSDYAKHHGYRYEFYTKCVNALPVYWQKIQLALDILTETSDTEYYVWCDTDTVVKNTAMPLESIIDQMDASIYIAQDGPKRPTLCAGFFIIKNNVVGRQFLRDCLQRYQNTSRCIQSKDGLAGEWAGECYEQGVMNHFLRTTYQKHLYRIPVLYLTNHYSDAMILHFWGNKEKSLQSLKRWQTNDHSVPIFCNPSPLRVCILLVVPTKVDVQALLDWWTATGLDVFVVGPQPLTVHNSIRYTGRSEKQAMSLAYDTFKDQFQAFDLIVKVAGKHLPVGVSELFNRIPSGTEVLLQYAKSQDIFGLTPALFPTLFTSSRTIETILHRLTKKHRYYHCPPLSVSGQVFFTRYL